MEVKIEIACGSSGNVPLPGTITLADYLGRMQCGELNGVYCSDDATKPLNENHPGARFAAQMSRLWNNAKKSGCNDAIIEIFRVAKEEAIHCLGKQFNLPKEHIQQVVELVEYKLE